MIMIIVAVVVVVSKQPISDAIIDVVVTVCECVHFVEIWSLSLETGFD
jgi:hypothetical protein